jgi:hypothetical protein
VCSPSSLKGVKIQKNKKIPSYEKPKKPYMVDLGFTQWFHPMAKFIVF